MAIHPAAAVAAGAVIDPSAEIGPFAVIGPGADIGPRTKIGAHAVVECATLGADNVLHPGCYVGTPPQDLKYAGEKTRLVMGDKNTVRECVTINRGTAQGGGLTKIGSGCLFMACSHVAHDCVVGDGVIVVNAVLLAGHVHIGDHAVLGGFTLVHQYCRLGAHCMTAVNTVIFKDVPPFLICSGYSAEPHGINVRGLKRRNFSDDAIESLRRAYKILYRSGHTLDEALKQLDAQARAGSEVAELVAFIKGSERGIIR